MTAASRFLAYRFRSTFRSRLGGYASLAAVLGLLGGTAMASVSTARQTQSSFPALLSATSASDLLVSIYDITADTGLPSHYSPEFNTRISRLPGVTRMESAITLNASPLNADGTPDTEVTSQITSLGSISGLYFQADRPGVVRGRMPDPNRRDEFVMTPAASRLLGLHVGDSLSIGFYSNAALASPQFGTQRVRPMLTIRPRLVGLVTFSNQIVQDDVDRLQPPLLFPPALTKAVLALSPDTDGPSLFGIAVAGGSRRVAAVKRELLRALPPTSGASFQQRSLVQSKVEASVRPESIALAVFGGIAAAAAIVISVLMISRQQRAIDEELRVLRAVGADPALTALDGIPGIAAAVAVGVTVAAGGAVLVSPLAPLGPVRTVFPAHGVVPDWAVLGLGICVLMLVPVLAALVQGRRAAPHRAARRSSRLPPKASALATAAASAGAPLPAVVGLRLALEPGRGPTAVPVRSTLVGAVLGVAAITATLTFGSGLHTLVNHPRLYGWNWTFAISATNVVPPQATTQLDSDPAVEEWSGYHQASVQIDGEIVPILLGAPGSAVAPPLLSGHGVDAEGQIVLGASTLADLHKAIGDKVVVTYGKASDFPFYIPPTRLTIVGTATLPAISKPGNGQDHLTIGRGAVVTTNLLPAPFQSVFENPIATLNGPELALVRMRPAGITAQRAAAQLIADRANKAFADLPGGAVGNHVVVLDVERPAQIANFKSMGAVPLLLAGGSALGVVVALTSSTAVSVRRRRRELAIMKALGFTRGQLAGSVAVQTSVAALLGIVAGIPLGIAGGRVIWTEFAQQIYVVPSATVPWASIAIVAAAALLLANIAGALPGRAASRVSTAAVLRGE